MLQANDYNQKTQLKTAENNIIESSWCVVYSFELDFDCLVYFTIMLQPFYKRLVYTF